MTVVGHFIDSLDPGGAETLIVNICQRLGSHSLEGCVFHLGNQWVATQCEKFDISHHVVAGHRHFQSWETSPLFAWQFARSLRQHRVDILHSHLYGALTHAAPAAWLAGIPHVGTLHDIYTIHEKRSRIRFLELAATMFRTKLIAVSHRMRNHFMSMGFFSKNAI